MTTIDEEIEKEKREEQKSELERKLCEFERKLRENEKMLRETFKPQPVSNERVTIPLEDYERLIIVADRYDKLINALMRSAELGYRGKEIYFDNATIGDIVRVLESDLYFELLEKLQAKEEEEGGE